MVRPVLFTDELVIKAMEEHFHSKGFASVSAVSSELGMSRVYLSQRLKKMELDGAITPEQRKEWANTASRAQLQRAQTAETPKNKKLNITLTPENYEWLKVQENSASETINGLVVKARTAG